LAFRETPAPIGAITRTLIAISGSIRHFGTITETGMTATSGLTAGSAMISGGITAIQGLSTVSATGRIIIPAELCIRSFILDMADTMRRIITGRTRTDTTIER
jgi:hypothetical protein